MESRKEKTQKWMEGMAEWLALQEKKAERETRQIIEEYDQKYNYKKEV